MVVISALLLAACTPAQESGAWEVDRMIEGVATLVNPSTGAVRTVAAASLPPGAKEGSVLRDARVDRASTRSLHQDITRSRQGLARAKVPSGASLDKVVAPPTQARACAVLPVQGCRPALTTQVDPNR